MNESTSLSPAANLGEELFFNLDNLTDLTAKPVLERHEDDEEYSIVRSMN